MVRPARRADGALSAVHDALVFLTMVSVSAAVLAPAVLAPPAPAVPARLSESDRAAQALGSVLATRTDVLDYEVGAAFLAGLDARVPALQHEMFAGLRQDLVHREARHGTVGDALAALMVAQLRIGGCGVNPLVNAAPCGGAGAPASRSFEGEAARAVREQLAGQVGAQYRFLLVATWEPVPGLPLGHIAVGSTPDAPLSPPPGATGATFSLTMPIDPIPLDRSVHAYRSAIEALRTEADSWPPGQIPSALRERLVGTASREGLLDGLAGQLLDDAAGRLIQLMLGQEKTGDALRRFGGAEALVLEAVIGEGGPAINLFDICRLAPGDCDPAYAESVEGAVSRMLREAALPAFREAARDRLEDMPPAADRATVSLTLDQLHRDVHPFSAEVTLWLWHS